MQALLPCDRARQVVGLLHDEGRARGVKEQWGREAEADEEFGEADCDVLECLLLPSATSAPMQLPRISTMCSASANTLLAARAVRRPTSALRQIWAAGSSVDGIRNAAPSSSRA